MLTNRRHLHQKGYSALAFILLIIAMCFTAFIAVPFCSTQASAAYTYSKASRQASSGDTNVKIDGTNFRHVEEYSKGGGIYFGPDDEAGINKIKKGEHVDKDFVNNGRHKGLRFPINYYDFNNGANTSLTTGKLSFDSFKKDTVQVVTLNNMDKMFGVGTGFFGKDEVKPPSFIGDSEKYNLINTSVVESSNSINYDMEGFITGTKKSDWTHSWEISNGLFYTFIKIPSEIAPYLSVKAEAKISTIGNITGHGNSGDYTYDGFHIPFLDLQIGSKINDDPKDLDSFKKVNYSQVNGNKANSNDSTLVRETQTLDLKGYTWIKILIGSLSNNTDAVYGSTNLSQQSYKNYLHASDVKLTFNLKAPNLHTNITTSSTDTYVKGTRNVSFEIAIDKKQFIKDGQTNVLSDIDNLINGNTNATNNGVLIKICYITESKFVEKGLAEIDMVNSTFTTKALDPQLKQMETANSYIFRFDFKIKENGKYRIRLYNGTTLLQESDPTNDYYEIGIDNTSPEKPVLKKIENEQATDNVWISNDTQGIEVSNILDNVPKGDVQDASSSGLKQIDIYLRKKDPNVTYNQETLQGLTNIEGTYSFTKAITSNVNQTIAITSMFADFFNYTLIDDKYKGYGDYIVFAKISDTVGNESNFGVFSFKYENEKAYKYNHFEISRGIEGEWLPATQFNKTWINEDELLFRFQITNEYKYLAETVFTLYNDTTEIAAFTYYDSAKPKPAITVNGQDIDIIGTNPGDPSIATIFYLKINIKEKFKSKAVVNILNLSIKVDKLGSLVNFGEDLKLNYDAKSPFDSFNDTTKTPVIDILTNKTPKYQDENNFDLYYTFRDNDIVINYLGSDLRIAKKHDGGMYFVIDCFDEALDEEYYGKYQFKIGEQNISPQIYNGNILIFIEKQYLGKNTEITVIDQADNKGSFFLPIINYDDTKYKISTLELMHLNLLDNTFVEVYETIIDVSQGLNVDDSYIFIEDRKLNKAELSSIANKEYARGEKVYFKNNASPTYADYKYVGYSINGGDIINDNSPIEFGKGSEVVNFNVKIHITKLIAIKAYIENKELSNLSTGPKFEYNKENKQIEIRNGNTVIDEGIVLEEGTDLGVTYDQTRQDRWEGLRNYKEGGITVKISVDDTKKGIKSKEPIEVVVYITKYNLNVTLNQSLNIKDETITQIYGNTTNIDLTYTALDNIDKFKIGITTENGIPFNKLGASEIPYNLKVVSLISGDTTDYFNNYNIKLKYNQNNINQLKLRVDPRELKVKFTKTPRYTYGASTRDVGPNFITMELFANSLVTNTDPLENDLTILGNPTLYEDFDLTKPVTYKTPANNNIVKNYYIGVDKLSIKEGNENFKLIVDNLTNIFYIDKAPLEIKLLNSTYTYGQSIDFTSYSTLKFTGLVAGDKENIINLTKAEVYFNDSPASTVDGYYSANKGYVVKYTFNNNLNNYTVDFPDQVFDIEKKKITIEVDISSAILSKVYDGIALKNTNGKYTTLVKGIETPILPIDIERLKNQFVLEKHYTDNIDLFKNLNAFTLQTEEGEQVLNVKGDTNNFGYKVIAADISTLNIENYEFEAVPNVDAFVITPKTMNAEITGFKYFGDDITYDHNYFNQFVRPYNSLFEGSKTIESFVFTIDGNCDNDTIDKFGIKLLNEKYELFGFDSINDLKTPVGRYQIIVYYDQKDKNQQQINNYVITQQSITFDVLNALYNLSDENLNSAIKSFTDSLVYTGKNIITDANKIITKSIVSDGIYLTFEVYTKETFINAGTYLKSLFINPGSFVIYDQETSTKNTNYSGVKINDINNKCFDLTIKQFEINLEHIKDTQEYTKVYDGKPFNEILELNNVPEGTVPVGTIVKATATEIVNVGTYNGATLILSIDDTTNYKLNVSSITKNVDVTTRTSNMNYVGSLYKQNGSNFSTTDFVFDNIIDKDKDTLINDIKYSVGSNLNQSLETNIPSITGDNIFTFTYKNVNYNDIKITVTITIEDINNIVDISLTTNNFTYNGNPITLTFTITKRQGGEKITETPSITVIKGKDKVNEIKDAGNYVVLATFDKGSLKGNNTFNVTVNKYLIETKDLFEINPTKEFDGTYNADLKFKAENQYGQNKENIEINIKKQNYSEIIGESLINYELRLVSNNNANINNYILDSTKGSIKGTIVKKGSLDVNNKLYIQIQPEVKYGDSLTFVLPKDNTLNTTGDNRDNPILVPGFDQNVVVGNVEFASTDVGKNIKVHYSFNSLYYELKVGYLGEQDKLFHEYNTSDEFGEYIPVNIERREVKVSVESLEANKGINASDVKIKAEFSNYLPKDTKIFREHEYEFFTLETKALNLPVGIYNIISTGFNSNNDEPDFSNYNMTFPNNIDAKLFVIGIKVTVDILGDNISFVYGNTLESDGTPIVLANKIAEIKNKIRFYGPTGEPIPLEDVTAELNKIEIQLVGYKNGNIRIPFDQVTKIDADTYKIEIKYKDNITLDQQNYVFDKDRYSAGNLNVVVNKKKIEFTFNPAAFEKDNITGFNEFSPKPSYQDGFFVNNNIDELMKKMLIAKDLSFDNTPEMTNIYYHINTAINSILTQNGLFVYPDETANKINAGLYNINLDNIYISFIEKDDNKNDNFEYIIPSTIEQYRVEILQQLIIPEIEYNNDSLKFEYLYNSMPEFKEKANLGAWGLTNVPNDIGFSGITYIDREPGNEVGEYEIFVKFDISNPNYKLDKSPAGYVTVNNKFEITPRLINVDKFDFNLEKEFDNILDVLGFVINSSITNEGTYNGDKTVSQITAEAAYLDKNVIVKDGNGIKIVISIKDQINYSFNKFNDFIIIINGVEYSVATDPEFTGSNNKQIVFIIKDGVKINPTKYKITADKLKTNAQNKIETIYNGTEKFDIGEPTIENGKAGNIVFTYLAEVLNKNVEFKNNKLNLTIAFSSEIDNVLSNVQVLLNKKPVPFKLDELTNKYEFSFSYDLIINPREVNLSTNAKIVKVYDASATSNIYYEKVTDQNKDYGKYTYEDTKTGNSINVNIELANIIANDDITIKFDLGSVNFNYVNASSKYKVNVKIANDGITGIDVPNYNIPMSFEVPLEITQRKVSIKIKDTYDTKITKVYDGTPFVKVNQSLTKGDYDVIGILANDDVKLVLNGNAEFSQKWAGYNIPITIPGARIESENYILDGKIEGLTGTITPREVYIDGNKVVIYNTRYFGPNSSNYNIKVVNDKNLVSDKEKDNTVTVYMPFKVNTASIGILDEDLKYNLKADIPMLFKDDVITFREDQELILDSTKDIRVLPVDMSDIDPNDPFKSDKMKAAYSYKIGNTSAIYNNDTLNVGVNETGEEAYNHKVHIQKFIVKPDYIYFDKSNNIFDKVYDGTTNLNSRVVAKIGILNDKGEDLAPFLTEQIKGINIVNKDNVYPSPNQGTYNITLDLDTDDIAMNFGQSANTKWYDLSQLPSRISEIKGEKITSTITKRIINVYITPYGKVYDGTNEAYPGIDFKIDVPTATTGKLEGVMPRDEKHIKIICGTSYYTSSIAGETELYIGNMIFDEKVGDANVKDNYIIQIRYDGPNGPEQTNSRLYPGVQIAKKDLRVTAGNITLTYGEGLPELNSAIVSDPIINKLDLVATDREDSNFKDSIVYEYINNKQNDVLNANTYNILKISSANEVLYSNYNLIYLPGNVIVEPLKVIVKLVEDSKYLTGEYSRIKNNVDQAIILKKNVDGNEYDLTDAERLKVKNFFRVIGIPTNQDDVGSYDLALDVIRINGWQNYEFNVDSFGKEVGNPYQFVVEPIEITAFGINETTPYSFEFNNRDYNQIILNSCIVKDDTAYNTIRKSIIDITNNLEYPTITDVGIYNNVGIKLEAYKYDINTGDLVPDPNYKVTILNLQPIQIYNKKIELAMRDCIDLEYNGKEQKYSTKYSGIPTNYIDNKIINVVFIGEDGLEVKTPTNVGKYTVLAYSIDDAYLVHSYSTFKITEQTVKDPVIREKAKFGYATANFVINKIVVSNVGVQNIQTLPIADINQFIANLKTPDANNPDKPIVVINDNNIKPENIVLSTDASEFKVPGIYNINISLVDLPLGAENYIVDNPLIVVQIITNKITDGKNVIVKTPNGNNINQDLVDAKLFYKEGDENDINAMLKEQKSLFGNIHQMVYAQFKVNGSKVDINSENVYIKEPVIIEIKLDANLQNKDLYLVTSDGACKKISKDKINYVTNEFGEACAKFETDDLGWFVYADAPVSKQARNATIAYSVLGVTIGVMLIAFLVLCIRAYKLKKLTK